MAIPPLFSNLPILRLFQPQGGKAGAAKTGNDAAGGVATDTVTISTAAQEKFSDAQAQTLASETRNLLAGGTAPLGLDPSFSYSEAHIY